MNNVKLFKIALLNSKKMSFKRKIFIAITVLCLLILSFLFCFYGMYKNFINNIYNNQNESKIIAIYDTYDKYNEYESIINSYNNENIVYVEKMGSSLFGYIDIDYNYSFRLLRNLKYYAPEIVRGSSLKNESEIVCPQRASYNNFDNLRYDELIDMNKRIGSNITLYFQSDNNEVIKKDFKLVGTYNADYSYSYNDCYIMQSEYEDITNTLKNKEYDDKTYVNLFNIYVNSYKNVDEINNYLNQHNITTSIVTIDDSFLNYSLLLAFLLLIIMTIILTIILIKFYKSYYQEEYYNIALYKALGYDDKSICKIIYFEIEIILFVALIVASVLLLMLIVGVTIYLKQFVSFRLTKINFPYLPFIIYYLVISIINYLFLKSDIKSVSNYSVKGLSEL